MPSFNVFSRKIAKDWRFLDHLKRKYAKNSTMGFSSVNLSVCEWVEGHLEGHLQGWVGQKAPYRGFAVLITPA
jgi:hypothetical protein